MLKRLRERLRRPAVDQQVLADWNRNGYLVLPGFFSSEALDAFDRDVEAILADRANRAGDVTIDSLEGETAGQRMRLKNAPAGALEHGYKINDLYLESEACRDLNLDRRLIDVLGTLLDGTPMVINSLLFGKGSQQPHHFDTYFMPPPTEGAMVVASICLEDQTEATGPLSYYPGSHRIAPYVFSNGGIASIPDEMDEATAYIEREIERHGLEREEFVGKAGDVFIWHAQLYHGGSAIRDPDRTRRTLVTHYWRAQDVPARRVGRTRGGGRYLIRDHQAVPEMG